uniref:Uncharacterized protein n=1 Tax=Hordeum vulgare subsp. vulgare TaxID=112509 RepID=A0A8I6Y5M2_HORVV
MKEMDVKAAPFVPIPISQRITLTLLPLRRNRFILGVHLLHQSHPWLHFVLVLLMLWVYHTTLGVLLYKRRWMLRQPLLFQFNALYPHQSWFHLRICFVRRRDEHFSTAARRTEPLHVHVQDNTQEACCPPSPTSQAVRDESLLIQDSKQEASRPPSLASSRQAVENKLQPAVQNDHRTSNRKTHNEISTDDVISFDGIPDPTSGDRRFNPRIQEKPDADDMLMERVMQAAKLRDVETTTSHIPSNVLDPYVVITQSCGQQGAYGYWMQPMGDGRTGYLQPVWMAC